MNYKTLYRKVKIE